MYNLLIIWGKELILLLPQDKLPVFFFLQLLTPSLVYCLLILDEVLANVT